MDEKSYGPWKFLCINRGHWEYIFFRWLFGFAFNYFHEAENLLDIVRTNGNRMMRHNHLP